MGTGVICGGYDGNWCGRKAMMGLGVEERDVMWVACNKDNKQ